MIWIHQKEVYDILILFGVERQESKSGAGFDSQVVWVESDVLEVFELDVTDELFILLKVVNVLFSFV